MNKVGAGWKTNSPQKSAMAKKKSSFEKQVEAQIAAISDFQPLGTGDSLLGVSKRTIVGLKPRRGRVQNGWGLIG